MNHTTNWFSFFLLHWQLLIFYLAHSIQLKVQISFFPMLIFHCAGRINFQSDIVHFMHFTSSLFSPATHNSIMLIADLIKAKPLSISFTFCPFSASSLSPLVFFFAACSTVFAAANFSNSSFRLLLISNWYFKYD